MIETSAPATSKSSTKSNSAWRSRLALACAILVVMILGAGAASVDWDGGLAMSLGQLAGMIAPLLVLMLLGWALAAVFSRPR